mgnify:FL=1
MNTLIVDFLLKETPTSIAIVDTKLNFISYSNQWLSDFTDNKVDIEGKHLFDAIPEMPKVFITAVELALKGKENINDGQKFISSSGRVQWLKWKVLPLKIDENVFGGLVIFLEDITTHQKEIELHNKTGSVARTGGWEVNLQTNTVYWTKTTREIHEVDEDFEPDLAQGINFYKEGIHREKITKLVGSAIEEGTPWDIELVIITAKGNEVWVRAIGEVEMLDNKVIRIIGTFQDIDARKKLELAHEEISERLKIATQTAQIGIWEYDIENNQLIWDDNMYLLYGIQENEFTGVYEAWQAGVHPYDMERGNLEIQQAISGEKEFDTEFRVMWPNGEIKHLKAFAKTIKDSKGKTVKLIGTNWDITELRSTELQLEKSKDSFTETFNNAAIGMALVSLKGNWIKVNSSLCKSLGYTEKEFFKLTFQDITHPEDINADLKLLSEVIEGKRESYQLEKRYIHIMLVLEINLIRLILVIYLRRIMYVRIHQT